MAGLLVLGCLLLAPLAMPAVADASQETNVVLRLAGDDGDAWAVAIRSHDEPTSAEGNEIWVRLRSHGPMHSSMASMGILELEPAPGGGWTVDRGGIGGTYQTATNLHAEPLGEYRLPANVDITAHMAPLDPSGEKIGSMWERRSMDPGEHRYFVAWAAGSERSEFQLRGEGFDVDRLILGEAYSLGNDELIREGGVHLRAGARAPDVLSSAPAYVGGGVTHVEDTGATLHAQTSTLGLFTEFHERNACGPAPFVGCFSAGDLGNEAASAAWAGGSARLSMTTPVQGHIANPWDVYWLMPRYTPPAWYNASQAGPYHFAVDRMTEVAGPMYRDPLTGTGTYATGTELLLSIAEIDYGRLSGLEG